MRLLPFMCFCLYRENIRNYKLIIIQLSDMFQYVIFATIDFYYLLG